MVVDFDPRETAKVRTGVERILDVKRSPLSDDERQALELPKHHQDALAMFANLIAKQKD